VAILSVPVALGQVATQLALEPRFEFLFDMTVPHKGGGASPDQVPSGSHSDIEVPPYYSEVAQIVHNGLRASWRARVSLVE